MRIRLPRETIRRLPKKVLAAILLVGVLLEIGGIPVVRVARKDRSRPYPCQDHPCGCASADECWHHCCCFSNKQKLVWASQHGVTPPDFVVAAAAQEADEPSHVCCDRDGSGACAVDSHDEEHACCRHRKSHDSVASTTDTHHDGVADETHTQVRFVLSDFARRCSGLPSIIMLFSDALPCVRADAWKPVEGLVEYLAEAPPTSVSAEISPPVPPPKLCRGVAA
jgi:hypothetical protein